MSRTTPFPTFSTNATASRGRDDPRVRRYLEGWAAPTVATCSAGAFCRSSPPVCPHCLEAFRAPPRPGVVFEFSLEPRHLAEWVPLVVLLELFLRTEGMYPGQAIALTVLRAGVPLLLVAGLAVSLRQPERSPQDLLARTWVVPR